MDDQIKSIEEKSATGTKQVFQPETIDDTLLPGANVATEVNSLSINTTGGRAQSLDRLGIVSTKNFISDSVSLNGTISRSASGFADIAGMSLNFTLKRKARMLFLATVSGRNTNNYKEGQQIVRFLLDSTVLGDPTYYSVDGIFSVQNISGTPTNIPTSATYTFHRVEEVEAGDHTIKLQHSWSVIGDAVVNGGPNSLGTQLTYLVLGS